MAEGDFQYRQFWLSRRVMPSKYYEDVISRQAISSNLPLVGAPAVFVVMSPHYLAKPSVTAANFTD